MTLEYNAATGEHTFKPPTNPYVNPQDALGRTAQLGSPVTRPIGAAHYSQPVPVKNTKYQEGYEVVSFQVELYDERGTWQQAGPIDEAHANFAFNEMVCDAPNVMRHPFKVSELALPEGNLIDAAATQTLLTRVVSAYFAETLYMSPGRDGAGGVSDAGIVYTEASATNPFPVKLATYAPSGTNAQIACMAVVNTAGVTRLWIGYFSGGAGGGLDAYATAALNAPTAVDASNGHTGAVTFVSGIIQAPNGDILLATNLGDLNLATNNTAALNLISFTTMQAQALGFFPVAVGPCSLSNYAPGALWLTFPDTSNGWFLANTNQSGDFTPKGRLLLSSYDALTLDPIDFPDLPFVSIATIYRGGIAACDRRSHFWYTGKDMVSLDGGNDRPVDSHKTRKCCGHAVVGDRFVWLEAEIDDRFSKGTPTLYQTVGRVLEYDPYRKRSRQVSKDFELDYGGNSLIVGGQPSLPFSPNTNFLHWLSIWDGQKAVPTTDADFGHWWRQYQPKTKEQGFASRSTDSDTSGGQAFDDEPTWRTPHLRHPALQGFEYTPIRAVLPNIESLAAGGADASLDIAILDSDGATIYTGTASADEPTERYPTVEFGEWPNRTWATSFQAEMTSRLGTGVTNKTTNVLPLTFEVVARRPLPRGVKL